MSEDEEGEEIEKDGRVSYTPISVPTYRVELENLMWSGLHFDFSNWQGDYILGKGLLQDLHRSGKLKLTQQSALKILSVRPDEYTQGWIPFSAEVPSA